jgi:phosphoribosylformylglycinamidine cyclo-ligase
MQQGRRGRLTDTGGPITYADAGVDYTRIDPAKALARAAAAGTAGALGSWGFAELPASRGATAFVWDEGPVYRAFVLECLGTKSLVADDVRPLTGRSHYDQIAQDTVATFVNDIVTVGAAPQVVSAYWATGSSDWFDDHERAEDLVRGWTDACTLAGVTWGAGETPALSGVVGPGRIDLAGACVGVVAPKSRLVLGDALRPGDAVVLVASSGIHANGISLARKVAVGLADGYATRLQDGRTLGEAILVPTHIYAPFLARLWAAGVQPHYLSNVTGHGWRKLMRAPAPYTYRMHMAPEPGALLRFLVDAAQLSGREAYGTLNMGAGYAVFVAPEDAPRVIDVARQAGLDAFDAGRVEEGPRRVIVEPAGIEFEEE